MEAQVQQALDEVIDCLKENTVIKDYQHAKEIVNDNLELKSLTQRIEESQKAIVHFQYYQKVQATKQEDERLNQYYKRLKNHPQVKIYREHLAEANDLLQYITQKITDKLNKED